MTRFVDVLQELTAETGLEYATDDMSFAIATLGCKVNQYESQLIREALVREGRKEQDFSEPGAHWYIINTCTVTHRSDAQWRRLIRQALRNGGRVVVTGCGATVYPEKIASLSEKLDVAVFGRLGEIFGVEIPSRITSFSAHARAFVNIQQGCNNFCSYCIVPHTRGLPWSRPYEEVISEISSLEDAGYQEIVLTGINIGLYQGGLAHIIERILVQTTIPRIRLSSVEPWTIDDRLIELVAGEKRVCDHIHLPLQSGCDKILKLMGRPCGASRYASILAQIRALSDSISIGSDIMVGFPTETEHFFDQSFSFVEELPVTYLHVFPFSPRPGTRAFQLPGRPEAAVVRKRASQFRELSLRKKREFMRRNLGREKEALILKAEGEDVVGMTTNYLNVSVRGKALPGQIRKVFIETLDGDALKGRANE
ncbi:MAG TPA: MiaB/RimO family radical SAM methylthiotransferase [Deltaproteobacteria bacterium]|nr:MiaB/RimO family radical SAM methylthiotransferase [Deltaproteobacteria bacterium]